MEWYEFGSAPLTVKGYDAHLIMTVTRFLAANPGEVPTALAMDVELSLGSRGLEKPVAIQTAYYGRLEDVRRSLAKLMRTGEGNVNFDSEHLGWSLKLLPGGSGDLVLLEGLASSDFYSFSREEAPEDFGNRNDHKSGWAFRFAMLTSRTSEPWLHDFAKQLEELNAFFGYW